MKKLPLRLLVKAILLEGKEIGLGQVAQIIEQAVTTDDFRNQSIELHHKKAGCDMDKLEEYQRWQNNLARVRFPRWKELPTPRFVC